MTLDGNPAADEVLVGFSTILRAAGMAITPDRTSAFVEAVSLAGFDDRTATYWSGRATLCSSLEDNELYDRAFTASFAASPEEVRVSSPATAARQPTGMRPPAMSRSRDGSCESPRCGCNGQRGVWMRRPSRR